MGRHRAQQESSNEPSFLYVGIATGAFGISFTCAWFTLSLTAIVIWAVSGMALLLMWGSNDDRESGKGRMEATARRPGRHRARDGSASVYADRHRNGATRQRHVIRIQHA